MALEALSEGQDLEGSEYAEELREQHMEQHLEEHLWELLRSAPMRAVVVVRAMAESPLEAVDLMGQVSKKRA